MALQTEYIKDGITYPEAYCRIEKLQLIKRGDGKIYIEMIYGYWENHTKFLDGASAISEWFNASFEYDLNGENAFIQAYEYLKLHYVLNYIDI